MTELTTRVFSTDTCAKAWTALQYKFSACLSQRSAPEAPCAPATAKRLHHLRRSRHKAEVQGCKKSIVFDFSGYLCLQFLNDQISCSTVSPRGHRYTGVGWGRKAGTPAEMCETASPRSRSSPLRWRRHHHQQLKETSLLLLSANVLATAQISAKQK